MAEINIYRCDICGAHSETKPPNYVSYWEGYRDGEKHIQHICDDCMAELKIAISKMKGSRADNIVFVKEAKMDEEVVE